MTTLPGTAQQAYVALQAFLGLADTAHQTAIDFVSPSTFQAIVENSTEVTLAASATDQAVNLAALFPALSNIAFIVVMDATNPRQPFSITTVSGSGRLSVAASSFFAYMPNGGVPPMLYLTNPSVSLPSLINIALLSN